MLKPCNDKHTMKAINNIPQIGLGLWKLDKETCADTVYEAIKLGYRHLDSAADYGNEKEVGLGIKRALDDNLCNRDDLWITSKLWNTHHAPEHVKLALQRTMDDLQVEYLDLYLIHFPIALAYIDIEKRHPAEWLFDPNSPDQGMELASIPLYQTWQAMEALVNDGFVANIGVCNYNSALIHDLMAYANIKPAMLQIESHPYLTQQRLLQLCQQYGIAVTAFSPLASLSYEALDMADQQESLLRHSLIQDIASQNARSAAQVLLRWGVQRGTTIIPKTSKVERLKENLNIFDFALSQTEMQAITDLNRNQRFNDPGAFCQAAFNTFHPIYD